MEPSPEETAETEGQQRLPAAWTSAAEDPSIDTRFRLLSNRRRRAVLVRLQVTTDGITTLGALATHIAACETEIAPQAVSSGQRKCVYVSLHQNHLPTLAAHDVIAYDRARGTVRRKNLDVLQPCLDLATADSPFMRRVRESPRGDDTPAGDGRPA